MATAAMLQPFCKLSLKEHIEKKEMCVAKDGDLAVHHWQRLFLPRCGPLFPIQAHSEFKVCSPLLLSPGPCISVASLGIGGAEWKSSPVKGWVGGYPSGPALHQQRSP